MLQLVALLWRGEARAQGMLTTRRWFTVVQGVGVAVVLISLTRTVQSAVLSSRKQSDVLSATQLGVLSVFAAWLLVANVLVVGEQSHTTAAHLRLWARPLPLAGSAVGVLLGLIGVGRSALFALTLVGSAAVGGALAAPDRTTALGCLLAALVLPLLAVAVGISVSGSRAAPRSPAFVLVPLTGVIVGATLPMPELSGVPGAVAAALAAPARIVLGLASPRLTWTLLGATAGLALVQLARLDKGQVISRNGMRGPLVDRLPAGRRLLVDLWIHRLRAGDLVAAGARGVVVSCLLLIGSTLPPWPGLPSIGVLALTGLSVLPLTAAGYAQARASSALPPEAETWLATAPIPAERAAWVRHLGATAATLPGAVLVGVVARAMVLAGAGDAAVGALLLWWPVSGVVTTAGWFGAGLALPGLRRYLFGLLMSPLAALRAAGLVVVAALGAAPAQQLTLLGVDLLLAGAGHRTARALVGRSG